MTRPAGPLLALVLAAAGCSAPVSRALLRAELGPRRAERSPPAPSSFGEDVPGLVHLHTRVSHDSPGPLEELVAAARASGARWACLTDHSTPALGRDLPRGEVGGVLLVPGEEVSAGGGSLLALGTSRAVSVPRKQFGLLADDVRAAGGVPLLGHVTHIHRLPEPGKAEGMAVYDLSDDFRATPVLRMPAALACLSSGDPERSAEGYVLWVQSRQEERRAIWDRYLAAGPCAGVAETNAHAKFRYLGRTFDPYAGLFGLVRNHALLPGLEEGAVLEAVRRGRLHMGFDAIADSGGARFEAFRGDRPAAAQGDAVAGPGLSLAVHLPLPARVRVLRDGRPWREGEGRCLQFPAEGPGVYRAEADLRAGGEYHTWILFNPLRVLP